MENILLILPSGLAFSDDDVDEVEVLDVPDSDDITLELLEIRSLSLDATGSDCCNLDNASSEQTCVRVNLRDLLRFLLVVELFRRPVPLPAALLPLFKLLVRTLVGGVCLSTSSSATMSLELTSVGESVTGFTFVPPLPTG